jgi:uncharacterized pyridoxamine 5'-phosphate oxidase family protein
MTEFKTSLSFSSYYSGDESPNVKLPQFMYIDGKMMHIATPSQTGKRYFKDIAKNIVPIPPINLTIFNILTKSFLLRFFPFEMTFATTIQS